MQSKFDMSMMGELKFFLGIQIHQSPHGIFINQAKYAQEILKKYGMTSCDNIGTPMATKHLDADLSGTPVNQIKYRSMVGALMYLTASRPDIVHATCYCACYQAKPTEKHLTAVKRIFWYLKDSINMGLWYPKDIGLELTAFSDSDHAGCLNSRKSTSGGIRFIGGDKLVSWSSKKQTALQSKYAQEILKKHGMTSCDSIGIPMATKHLDADMSGTPVDQTKYRSMVGALMYLTASRPNIVHATCYCARYQAKPTEKHLTAVKRIFRYLKDSINIGIHSLSCNQSSISRTKHIGVRYHFIKEHVEKGIVELFFVGTEYQLADLFTKALSGDRFKYLVRRLGMRCLTQEELEVLENESA
ncbi:retrovirus-related pol polyprotein from transposon TNT 1-94 [Tanacetum coccineum]